MGRSHLRRSPCDLLLRLASPSQPRRENPFRAVVSSAALPALRACQMERGKTFWANAAASATFFLAVPSVAQLPLSRLSSTNKQQRPPHRGRPSSGASSAKANHVYYNELRSETHRSMPYSCPLGRTYSRQGPVVSELD